MSQEVEARLAEIDARWKAAAEGPWRAYEGALVDVAFLREQVRKNGEMANLLLDMPRRIAMEIRRECPDSDVTDHVGDHCDFQVAANIALNVGDLVAAELLDMDTDEQFDTQEDDRLFMVGMPKVLMPVLLKWLDGRGHHLFPMPFATELPTYGIGIGRRGE